MNRIILVGKAGSGKDHMRKIFQKRGFEYAVSYTTRPPREGEVDGKDYYFLDDAMFMEMNEKGLWYEWVEFNGWKYGTTNAQFYSKEPMVFIMTPVGISHIKEEDRSSSLIIYLDVDRLTRIKRLENRNMPGDSVWRRIQADSEDFKNFKNYDICVKNDDF
jgi:guanylate kinase